MVFSQKLRGLVRGSAAIWVWLLGLAMLSVGARNFEQGLNLDAPLYAKIAWYLSEAIKQGGDWVLLNGGTPDFVPFTEHTHGVFWIVALLFQFLPAEDWVARIPGHLFYVSNLFLIYTLAKKQLNEKAAVWSVLLLITWPIFSNFHSTLYLDPGALFFGLAFLWSYSRALVGGAGGLKWAVASGFFLASCFLVKGMTIFAFGLPAGALGISQFYFTYRKSGLSKSLTWLLSHTITVLLVFGVGFWLYWSFIQQSAVPDFLERYWNRQFTNRFAREIRWDFIFHAEYWKRLLVDTNYLLLLLPVAVWKLRSSRFALFLFFCVLSVSGVYTYSGRVGGQYWLLIMPPLAILLGALLAHIFKVNPATLRKLSLGVALTLVCVIQYLPFPTHFSRIPGEIPLIVEYRERYGIEDLILNIPRKQRDFIFASPFSWYGKTKVLYSNPQSLKKDRLEFVNSLLNQSMIYEGPEGSRLDYANSENFMLLDFVERSSPACVKTLTARDGGVHTLRLAREFANAAFYVPSASVVEVPVRCVN